MTRTIPTLALLIEQSNGMDQPLEEGKELTRWDALKEVLLGESGVIAALERDVRLGVVLYGNPPPYFPECPELTEASQIELTGPACEAFMEREHELRASFPCDVVVVR